MSDSRLIKQTFDYLEKELTCFEHIFLNEKTKLPKLRRFLERIGTEIKCSIKENNTRNLPFITRAFDVAINYYLQRDPISTSNRYSIYYNSLLPGDFFSKTHLDFVETTKALDLICDSILQNINKLSKKISLFPLLSTISGSSSFELDKSISSVLEEKILKNYKKKKVPDELIQNFVFFLFLKIPRWTYRMLRYTFIVSHEYSHIITTFFEHASYELRKKQKNIRKEIKKSYGDFIENNLDLYKEIQTRLVEFFARFYNIKKGSDYDERKLIWKIAYKQTNEFLCDLIGAACSDPYGYINSAIRENYQKNEKIEDVKNEKINNNHPPFSVRVILLTEIFDLEELNDLFFLNNNENINGFDKLVEILRNNMNTDVKSYEEFIINDIKSLFIKLINNCNKTLKNKRDNKEIKDNYKNIILNLQNLDYNENLKYDVLTILSSIWYKINGNYNVNLETPLRNQLKLSKEKNYN